MNHSYMRVYRIIDAVSLFMDRFIGSDNPDTYFTDTQRTRVAYEILETAPYGKRQKGEIGKPVAFFVNVTSFPNASST